MDNRISLFEKTLKLWSDWGERPHQLFDIADLDGYTLDKFIEDLNETINIGSGLYRYIIRKTPPVVGDVILFSSPTSWSLSHTVCEYMAEEIENAYILCLIQSPYSELNYVTGIYNAFNQFNEDEFIVIPFSVKVIQIREKEISCVLY